VCGVLLMSMSEEVADPVSFLVMWIGSVLDLCYGNEKVGELLYPHYGRYAFIR
jgi:hypothetical protein